MSFGITGDVFGFVVLDTLFRKHALFIEREHARECQVRNQ